MSRNVYNHTSQGTIVRQINAESKPNPHQPLKIKEDHVVLNGYLLTNSLNGGHSGNIFKGIHMTTLKEVAVKCCTKNRNWLHEVNALNTMNHPNIVSLIGKPTPFVRLPSNIRYSMDKDNTVYSYNVPPGGSRKRLVRESKQVHILGVEYAKHGDLYELLIEKNNEVFSEDATRYIIKELTNALLYALNKGDQGNGISHRDVKLENTFVSKDGTIKLGDWGLCAMNSRERTCTTSCGTLGYMAPEMICREEYVAEKVDVWALGIILFSCVFGIRPYKEPKQRKQHHNDNKWKDEWLSAMEKENWEVWWLSHGRDNVPVKNASDNLKDLIENIFAFKSNERISLLGIACHPWILEKEQGKYTKKDFLSDVGLVE
jgi:serine/threonine protein kinase